MVEGRQVIDNKIIINERDAYGQLVGFKMGLEKIVLFAGLFVALFAFGSTEIVESSTCTETNESVCKVGEVRVEPCAGGKLCSFRKGTNASLAFDFTPNFATSNLKTMVYWDNGGAEIPFVGFGSDDACTYTSCPTVPGQSQAMNYNLHVGLRLPKGRYPLKWKVWNVDNVSEMCCFKIAIKLMPKKNK